MRGVLKLVARETAIEHVNVQLVLSAFSATLETNVYNFSLVDVANV